MSDKVLGIISGALKAAEQDVDQTYDGLARAVALALSAAGYAVVPVERLKEIADWLIGDGTDATSSPNSREMGRDLLAAVNWMQAYVADPNTTTQDEAKP